MNIFSFRKRADKGHYPTKKKLLRRIVIGTIVGIVISIFLNLIEKRAFAIRLFMGAANKEVTAVSISGIVIITILAVLLPSLKERRGDKH